MTEHLRERFGQEKIILMGHSWGSYLGVKTIQKYPERYAAYIGIGQVTDQKESERIAYDYMLANTTPDVVFDTAANISQIQMPPMSRKSKKIVFI